MKNFSLGVFLDDPSGFRLDFVIIVYEYFHMILSYVINFKWINTKMCEKLGLDTDPGHQTTSLASVWCLCLRKTRQMLQWFL